MTRRGPFRVVHTETLFLNDNEPGIVEFDLNGKSVLVQVEFRLSGGDEPKTNPSISINFTRDRFLMVFTGWNGTAYSAINPEELGMVESTRVRFAVMNTYLDGTNKMDIQFYVRS
jgi:hypothetical protein